MTVEPTEEQKKEYEEMAEKLKKEANGRFVKGHLRFVEESKK